MNSRQAFVYRLIAIIFLALLIAATVLPGSFGIVVKKTLIAYEKVALFVWPSAERADAFGERHFSAENKMIYDVRAAEYFYRKLLQIDANNPYVYHQLARIEFLKGHFATATIYIDTQIKNHGDSVPDAYYIRGLIEGYMGRYKRAVSDYAHYLEIMPNDSWAALNDYAWVLLMSGEFDEASRVTEEGIKMFPRNAWLLNSGAVAHYELGEYELALDHAARALESVSDLTERDWLIAYPGNDPEVARQGIETLKNSATVNVHKARVALEEKNIQ